VGGHSTRRRTTLKLLGYLPFSKQMDKAMDKAKAAGWQSALSGSRGQGRRRGASDRRGPLYLERTGGRFKTREWVREPLDPKTLFVGPSGRSRISAINLAGLASEEGRDSFVNRLWKRNRQSSRGRPR
jgi:hypothetical protein